MKYLLLSMCVLALAGCGMPADTTHVKVPYCKTHGGVVALNTGGLNHNFMMVCADGTYQDMFPKDAMEGKKLSVEAANQ